MIEETMRMGNQGFGAEIVQVAQKIREKRDQKNNLKDYVGQHMSTVKNWHEVQAIQSVTRKIKEESK